MGRFRGRLAGLMVVCSLAAALAASAWAQTLHAQPDPEPPEAAGEPVNRLPGEPIAIEPASTLPAQPLTPVSSGALPDMTADVQTEAYLDGLFAGEIAAGRVVGAAIVVIKDGRVLVSKGYGYADAEARRPVDPQTTLFKVASVSKLFTALLVMQEVEAGRLDLDASVNGYLKTFKVPDAGPEPVSLANLLSHTVGFDDRYLRLTAPPGQKIEPIGVYLAGAVPAQVMPHGKVLNYSNYGYALAGYLAELSSGQEFRAAVQARILTPLKMERSGFGAAEERPGDVATGYGAHPQGLRRVSSDRLRPYPAGGLAATAGDMERFMLALMNGGVVVKPETLDLMTKPQIVPGRTQSAWGLGFALGETNGVRWVGHGGALPGFAAELRLNRETKSGIFLALNRDNTFGVVQPIMTAASARLWPPRTDKPVLDTAAAAAQAAKLAGRYVGIRRARADVLALGAASAALILTAGPEGALVATVGAIPERRVFRPESDGVWFNAESGWRLATYRAEGIVEDGVLLGAFAYQRAGFGDDFGTQSLLLALAALVATGTLAAWTTGFLARRLYGEPQAAIPFGARATGVAGAIVSLMFLGGVLGGVASLTDREALNGELGIVAVAVWASVVLAPVALAALAFAAMGFGPGLRRRLAQGAYAVLAAAMLFIVWFAWRWNLHPLGI